MNITSNHRFFAKYLKKNIMASYDDELRIFLVTCLKQIDYFQHKKISEDNLTLIAMHMIAMTEDRGSMLLDVKDSHRRDKTE